MADTRSAIVAELADQADRAKTQLANLRQKSAQATEKLVSAGAAVGAAAAAGYVEGRYPDKNVFGATIGEAMGLVMVVAGLGKFVGKQSDLVLHGGVGALSYSVGRRAHKKGVEAAMKTPTGKAKVSGSVQSIRSAVDRAAEG